MLFSTTADALPSTERKSVKEVPTKELLPRKPKMHKYFLLPPFCSLFSKHSPSHQHTSIQQSPSNIHQSTASRYTTMYISILALAGVTLVSGMPPCFPSLTRLLTFAGLALGESAQCASCQQERDTWNSYESMYCPGLLASGSCQSELLMVLIFIDHG